MHLNGSFVNIFVCNFPIFNSNQRQLLSTLWLWKNCIIQIVMCTTQHIWRTKRHTHIFNVCSRLHIIAIIAVQLCSSYKGPHFHLVVRNTSILHTNSVIQIRFPRWYYTSTPWCFTRVLLENDSRVHGFYRKKVVRLGSDFVGSMASGYYTIVSCNQ